MEECLFHQKRDIFDDLSSEIQSLKWIPRQYAHRIAMAICCCRKIKGKVSDIESYRSQIDNLYETLASDNSKECTLSGALENFLSLCRNQLGEPDYCTNRLVIILFKAKQKDFTMLLRENVSSNKHDVGKVQTKSTQKQKITGKQIECMVRKRKKKFESQQMTVSMFPGNTKKLDSTLYDNENNTVKKNSSQWVMEYYPHIINNRNFDNKVNQTHVKLWAKDMKTLNEIKSKVLSNAKVIQLKEDEAQRQRRQARLAYRIARSNNNYEDKVTETVLQPKEQLSDDFWKKSHKTSLEKAQTKKPASSPMLEGGHCLQCLKPYTGLKDTSLCTFHPGFVNFTGVWSCCPDNLDESPEMDFDCHSTTGCTTSATHVWRPHARRTHGSVKKETYIDHQYARSRHIKHQYEKRKRSS